MLRFDPSRDEEPSVDGFPQKVYTSRRINSAYWQECLLEAADEISRKADTAALLRVKTSHDEDARFSMARRFNDNNFRFGPTPLRYTAHDQ